MRYFLISLFLFTTFSSFSQTPDFKGGGAIVFDEVLYVFPPVKEEGGPVHTTFTFTNTGKGPLRIKNVLTSCGCTTPEWTNDIVPPGGRGFVKATFDPKNRPGHFSRTLTVITNGSPESVVLTVEGDVVSGNSQMLSLFPGSSGNLRFSHRELIIPGINEDDIDTIWLGLYNPSKKPITVRNVVTPLQMRFESRLVLLYPEQGENIMMTYNAKLVKALGNKIDTIILVTNDDSIPNKKIRIRANVLQNFGKLTPEQRQNAPVFSIDKMEADGGEVYQGESAKYTFEITNKGKSDLVIRQIYSVSGTTDGTIPNMVIKKGKTAKLSATLNTKGMHGKVEDYLQLIVNDPKQSVVNLKLTAKVVIPGVDPITN